MSKLVKVECQIQYDKGLGVDSCYEETEFVVGDIEEKGVILSYIKRSLVTPYFKKKINGFKRVRQTTILSITDVNETPEQSTELQKLMLDAIELSCVPTQLDDRSEVAKIQALKQALQKKRTAITKAKNKKNGTKVD